MQEAGDLIAHWHRNTPPLHITASLIAAALGVKFADGRPLAFDFSADENELSGGELIAMATHRPYTPPQLGMPIPN